ncbi:MAG: hypothetical protein BJ554DRAFT_294 [Olpidium bornovanus]|uniref:Uncharacterized protein n=1 Tax=Olpidium bornovanus TaxID=278681 RepID=A0A8H7ZU55_9FUNG|nr:MAG: hypothetical protein BJ554DRAFT_294 [Olpidium bornovanus]
MICRWARQRCPSSLLCWQAAGFLPRVWRGSQCRPRQCPCRRGRQRARKWPSWWPPSAPPCLCSAGRPARPGWRGIGARTWACRASFSAPGTAPSPHPGSARSTPGAWPGSSTNPRAQSAAPLPARRPASSGLAQSQPSGFGDTRTIARGTQLC